MSPLRNQYGLTHVFGPKCTLAKPIPTYHVFARRPIHVEKRRFYWKKLGFGLKDLFQEFCSSATIHGIHYIGASKTLLGSLGWLIVFVLSMLCCGMLIQKTFQKWNNSPVIVSFDDTPMAVWKIPFPAITICPEDRISLDVMNFTEDFYTQFHTNETLDEHSQDRLMAVLQICDDFFHGRNFYKYPNITKEVVLFLGEVLIGNSIWCEQNDDFCNVTRFSETLTADGICFTYNGFSQEDMFNDGVLHNQYKYLTEERKAVNWTMEGGYVPGTPFETYPLRGTGYALPLKFELDRMAYDMEEYCTASHRFKVILHSPDEYPLTFAKHVMVSLDQLVEIAIRPEILTTSKDLANYAPNRRQCFFNHERQLKFFRVYNQNNCELECITNHTLRECGCVKFSMPRSQETRVCNLADYECVTEAYQNLQLKNRDQFETCNCMSACNSIKIETEVTSSSNDDSKAFDLRMKIYDPEGYKPKKRNFYYSILRIFYKEAEFLSMRRGELFGLTDFIANCGGILGLCLGVSVVSLVELVYFCFARPLLLLKKTTCHLKKQKKKAAVVFVKEHGKY